MRYIFRVKDHKSLDAAIVAARSSIKHPDTPLMGVRVGNRFFSVTRRKASISVAEHKDEGGPYGYR